MAVGRIELELTANIQKAVDALNKMNVSSKNSSSSVKGLTSDIKNISNATQKMAGTFNNVGRIVATSLGFGSLQQSLRTVTNYAWNATQSAMNLAENYNLFTVAIKSTSDGVDDFNANLEDAIDFQSELNRQLGVSFSNSIRYQGFFMNLSSSLGIANDSAQLLSENLTKLTYDLSSLYNIDFNTMYIKLQSGLVGQTKPLRSIGVDVTQQTLQPTLYSLGINQKVTELTQAQKVMLRYIEILNQTTSAQGDMARTIESPANQMRVLKDQWQEMSMWFGTFFMGLYSKVLPALNGVVIAFKNIFRSMSNLFGFNLEDYQFISADSGVSDLLSTLEDTTDASEELKKSLMGFDELNVISDSSSSTGYLTENLETTRILEEALQGYDNLMSDVQMKANDISNTILEWLGFTIDTEGSITGIEGGLARIASIAFDNVNDFFKNMKLFVDDVASWLQAHPEWSEWLINTGIQLGLLAGGVWLFYNPFWAIVTAIGVFITYYDDLKKMWEEMTPAEKVITGILALAAAVALLKVATLGLPAALSITAGVAALGLAGFGVFSLLDASQGGTEFASNAMNMGLPAYQGNWSTRAEGGFPSTGEMFIAREAGPELVGSIGGRTAVANNDQIVASVSQGVANAVASVIGNGGSTQTVNIYLDDTLVGNALIDSINRTTKNTGKTVLV